jgi:hypothetical protein
MGGATTRCCGAGATRGWRLEAGVLGSALGIGGDWAEETSSSEPVSCECEYDVCSQESWWSVLLVVVTAPGRRSV